MSKLYVFGIGGTGARVLRALTMLLSCGVDCKAESIVPIIIDPDDSAADKTRSVEAMNRYMSIRSKLYFTAHDENRFFGTEIRNVPGMQNFGFRLDNTRNCKFEGFIGLDTLGEENQALVRLLFSQENLGSDMKVGFKGNPNIGSVVLNQFATSKEYQDFANDFRQGDRIFIISSIFGGTGASGFPLLLKTLRADQSAPNWKFVQDSKIGAVTVLPYFNVTQDNNSGVDSSTFISKTKAALSYYERNISGNGSINSLYYIGDRITNTYDNHDGGSDQKNDAHLVELCAALAILDFAAIPDSSLGGGNTQHYEYGLDKDGEDITFSDLGPRTKDAIQKRMTQFLLMDKYLEFECQKEYRHQPWAIVNGFDESFFIGDYYKTCMDYLLTYWGWLTEMKDNKRSFKPFNLEEQRLLFDMVEGVGLKKDRKLSSEYALFDDVLNSGTKLSRVSEKERRFFELFFRATEKLIELKYNY